MNLFLRFKGFLFALVTSATFGLIPLFTLPLMTKGMRYDSILFYRFTTAALVPALLMGFRKESFAVRRDELPFLFFLGICYTCSAMFLFWGYTFMPAGVATTLHFTFPVFVTLLMVLFFGEKLSVTTNLALVLAIAGVGRLSINDSDLGMSAAGLAIVLFSAVAYALYIVTVNKSRIRSMTGRKLTFYVFITSSVIFAVKAIVTGGIQPIPDTPSALNLLLLALIPTVISNITLIYAVRYIGGTLTSVMGAMEPVTAVCVGVLVFGEPFTGHIATGIVLIIIAVSIIVLKNPLARLLRRFR